jgi:hypothetical protein
MKLRSLILAASVCAAGACHDATEPSQASPLRLALARQRWASRGYHDYRFTLQRTCFCPNTNPLRIVVVHDTVNAVVDLTTGDGVPRTYGLTVDDLFDVIRRAQEAGTPIEARYDPALGFPINVVDNGPAMAYDGGAIYNASDVDKGVFNAVP